MAHVCNFEYNIIILLQSSEEAIQNSLGNIEF